MRWHFGDPVYRIKPLILLWLQALTSAPISSNQPPTKRKSRGFDLAYLTALPPDQARARRFVHEAMDSDIVIARMVGASQREGRRARRKLPKVRPMKTALRSA
jgi:hypothetical protein